VVGEIDIPDHDDLAKTTEAVRVDDAGLQMEKAGGKHDT
jgi:hypothetical protein